MYLVRGDEAMCQASVHGMIGIPPFPSTSRNNDALRIRRSDGLRRDLGSDRKDEVFSEAGEASDCGNGNSSIQGFVEDM
jgi:hypothetical protein